MPGPPGPGFGDSIGAMTIAGGIMGALFHRERTGEATTVDVSLLSSGMWAMGQAYALSLLLNQPWQGPPSNCTAPEPAGAQLHDQGRAPALLLLPPGQPVLGRALRRSSAGPKPAPTPASPTTTPCWRTRSTRRR